MNPVLAMILIAAAGVGSYEGLQYAEALRERRQVFAQARAYADQVGKDLLVIGAPMWRFNHPCGDMTVDIDPGYLRFCPETMVADVRDLPFADDEYGACYCSHVLEHLATVADCKQALQEMSRVAGKVFVVVPKKRSLLAQVYYDHHLWITPVEGGFIIELR